MKHIELRCHQIELRSNEDNSLTVSGYVNMTEKFSEVLGQSKRFVEKISKGAFNRALKNTKSDIHFLAEHNAKQILSSTRNGSLKLTEDENGLFMEATIVNTSYGEDYFKLIDSGILQNMSFGFTTIKDSWKSTASGIFERTIEELELFEVSVVRDPAYSQSTISARGIDLVTIVEIPLKTIKKEEEKTKMKKTEYRYGNYKNEVEIRKEGEICEFNDNLRNLQMTSGSETLIPQTVADILVEKLAETSLVFERARKFPSVSGSLKIPRETAVGVVMFVGEGENLSEQAMSLGEVSLTQKRAGAYIALSNQLINDAAINMADYIPNLLAKRTFKTIEKSILHGTEDTEFKGIIPDQTVEAMKLSANATDAQLLDLLLDMVLNIHPDYLPKSQFIMSRTFYNRISKLRDAVGNFYVQNGQINGKPSFTLFGLEIVITDSLEDGTSIGHTPVVLGSLEDGYAIMIKEGAKMTMIQDTEQALRGSIGFLFDIYLDGSIYNPDALTKLTIVA